MFKLRNITLTLLVLLVALPTFALVSAQDAPPIVSIGHTDELGDFLVGPTGFTLYLFTNDSMNTTACYERCAEVWPPLLVRNEEALASAGDLPGELGVIERTTGTLQVTYNGIPLYFWYLDYAVGETKGQGVGNVWWVIPPVTVYAEQVGELGSVLVGPTGMTLYRFANDTAGSGASTCTGDCETNWPPLTVEAGDPVAAGLFMPGEIDTIEREDGSLQVTYNGWPLYYYHEDMARGDANGEGVGDVWWTVVPETVVVDGDMLTAANGMTLYTFAEDEAGSGESACTGECNEEWEPFTIGEGERLAAGAGAEGELGTITLEEGDLQVTYNGWPLYFYAEDAAPGDAMGAEHEGWTVAAP